MAEFTPNIFAAIEPDEARVDKEKQNQLEAENPQEKSERQQGITAKVREAADPSSIQ